MAFSLCKHHRSNRDAGGVVKQKHRYIIITHKGMIKIRDFVQKLPDKRTASEIQNKLTNAALILSESSLQKHLNSSTFQDLLM